MGNVITTVEVVIDEDLPVAMNIVGSAIEVVQFADAERCKSLDKTAEKIGERHGVVVEVHEDEALPGFDSNGYQAILCAVEILHTFKLGHAFQGTVEAVVPAVIGTMQERSLAAGFGHDRSGVVAANIVESAQSAVVSANHDNRLTGDGGGDELTGRFHLLGARDELPGLAEHAHAFEIGDARIDVPGCRNG